MVETHKNLAASVRQRLLSLSRQQGRVFDVTLVMYGLERLIYRLSISEHRDRFILKGGMLVALWIVDENRVTRDVDFLAHGSPTENQLLEAFTEIFNLETNDGLRFDIAALEVSAIRADQKYKGVRLKTLAYLENTRIPITIDIGFGDSIYDPAYRVCIPSLLDMPTANVRAYPPAAVIAEKFQAIVRLGLVNGRMKDYYDLWVLPDSIAIESADLDVAILVTFRRRETAVPRSVPIGLSDEFAADEQKSRQWAAFAASVELESLTLKTVVQKIWSYIGPSCQRLTDV